MWRSPAHRSRCIRPLREEGADTRGQEAHPYDFSYDMPQNRAHGMQVIVLVGASLNFLTFVAPEANYDVVQQNLQSVTESFVFP